VRPSDRQFKRRVKHIGKHKGANVGEKLENFPMGPRNLVEFVFREELVIVGEQPLIVTFELKKDVEVARNETRLDQVALNWVEVQVEVFGRVVNDLDRHCCQGEQP
jgi:hypothetical protein